MADPLRDGVPVVDLWDLIAEKDAAYKRQHQRYREIIKRERRRRRDAEANAKQFHALLLQERIRNLPVR